MRGLRSILVIAAALAAVELCGCGESGKRPERSILPPKDVGGSGPDLSAEDAANTDNGSAKRDGSRDTAKSEGLVSKKDKGPPKLDGSPITCAPYTAKSNSGTNCTADPKLCTSPDEMCLGGFKNAAGQTVAMCVGKCCFDETKAMDDPANRCPTKDPTKQLATCLYGILGSPDMACGWVCAWDSSGTIKTYDCPNTTDWDCVVDNPAYPNDKVCVLKSGAKLDGSVPKTDGQVKPSDGSMTISEAGAVCSPPFQAKANSGKSCTTDPGLCTADEICLTGLTNAAGSAVGMCLGKCCANLTSPQDPANKCPTGSATNALSICAFALKGQLTMTCAWACSVTSSGTTQTFDCPNATDYDCVVLFTSQPDIKFCVPKK